jgi:chemotaxis signal transduction protein
MADPLPLKALTARAGDHWCALPLPRVRRVIHALALHPLPGASDEIAGLAEVDGEPLVILSLEKLIGAPPGPTAEFPVTLLVEAGPENATELVGLAADEAGDIIRVDEASIVGPPRGFVRGETRRKSGVVRVLDPLHLGKDGG